MPTVAPIPRLIKKPRPAPKPNQYLKRCHWRLRRFDRDVERYARKAPDIRERLSALEDMIQADFEQGGGPLTGPPMSEQHKAWIQSLPPEQAARAFVCRLWFQHAPSVRFNSAE